MNPEEIPIPLEKTVEIKNGTVEVSIAEKKMTDKEKKVYRTFMAKCVAASEAGNKKEAMAMCAMDFNKMKEELMKEDEEEEEEDEEEEEEENS
jgi:hypothetical protein